MHSAAILGTSGYAGQEVLDRVLRNPELEVVALGSDTLAGSPAGALDVRLNGSLPYFTENDDALAAGADVVFACLGHERAALLEPPADTVVVDLSGAHRLQDPALYPAWYGFDHPHPESLSDWSHVVPELAAPPGLLVATAEIGVFEDRATGRAVVICALDNLGKGAAGQALQNANLALGLEKTAGLRLAGVLV